MQVGSAQMVVAIDGPSGSGKSTVARAVATRLGFGYLDTGAMYRAVTWLVLRESVPLDQLADQVDRLSTLVSESALRVSTVPSDRSVSINGHDVTEVIRGPEVTAAVSAVAASPVVRSHLSRLQRDLGLQAIAERGGAVVEGRDIGTAIFPDARLKLWLTASAEARGQRRATEHSDGAAPQAATVEDVVEDLARRDRLDSGRAASPLQLAPDAHVLDTTALSAHEVVDAVVALWQAVELPGTTGAPKRRSDAYQDTSTGAGR